MHKYIKTVAYLLVYIMAFKKILILILNYRLFILKPFSHSFKISKYSIKSSYKSFINNIYNNYN